MLDGNVDAWEDYCKLRKVKDLIRKKKIDISNDVENIMRDVGKNSGLLFVEGQRVRRRQ